MLAQRRRRWSNIKSTLAQRLVFTGMCLCLPYYISVPYTRICLVLAFFSWIPYTHFVPVGRIASRYLNIVFCLCWFYWACMGSINTHYIYSLLCLGTIHRVFFTLMCRVPYSIRWPLSHGEFLCSMGTYTKPSLVLALLYLGIMYKALFMLAVLCLCTIHETFFCVGLIACLVVCLLWVCLQCGRHYHVINIAEATGQGKVSPNADGN